MLLTILTILAAGMGLVRGTAFSATIEELQQKINERNQVLKQLEAEISQYQSQLGETSAKAKSLQSALADLDKTIKKLTAEMNYTQNSLVKTNYTIEQLGIDIAEKEQSLDEKKNALSRLIKTRFEEESKSTLSNLLTVKSLGDIWTYYDQSVRIQEAIGASLGQVAAEKSALEKSKAAREGEKKQLASHKETLEDQKKLVEASKKEQNSLLSKTKSTEASYKKELEARLALKNAFEAELHQYEADLKIAIDPSSIPKVGTTLLEWPLASVRITQLFGDTEFSRQHAQAYSGKGHNGIDLAASVGTVVKAAASGVVVGAGNTDTVCPGASYGQWVLIEHNNGLSSLYAHLSLIKVAKGQSVNVGDVVGYSGNTGYTTGPHLHFTVYASQGVQVLTRKSVACGGTYTMPIADLKAYINPMLYLPPL